VGGLPVHAIKKEKNMNTLNEVIHQSEAIWHLFLVALMMLGLGLEGLQTEPEL
jgi:hypothetical protein